MLTSSIMEIQYEPSLMEDVVRIEMGCRSYGDPLRIEYRGLLDDTYHYGDTERWAATGRVHRWVFVKLGWPEFFQTQLKDLLSKATTAGVFPAHRDEGCFVDPQRRLQVRLRSDRFSDRESLRSFLRHEQVHAMDILDPDFGYYEELLDEPTRQRYAALWCRSVDDRLDGEVRRRLTHPQLLEKARAHARPKCPFCSLPAVRWVEVPKERYPRVRLLVPGWTPEQQPCERCFEWLETNAE